MMAAAIRCRGTRTTGRWRIGILLSLGLWCAAVWPARADLGESPGRPSGAAAREGQAGALYSLAGAQEIEETSVTLPGGVPLVLVRIPGGSSRMGSPLGERSRESDEGPVHDVHLDYDFYMGKYEVTQAQWVAVMGRNPAREGYGVGDNYPVYYVHWDQINRPGGFLDKLNEHLALTSQALVGARLRLPSEAEWEYACRVGTETRFYFGDSLTDGEGNWLNDTDADGPAGTLPGNRSDYMWYRGNNTSGTAKPVGQKLPNAFGLYDMHGNVYEFCLDWDHSSYNGAPSDGSVWNYYDPPRRDRASEEPKDTLRASRGGSYATDLKHSRSANRAFTLPANTNPWMGFRVVRSRFPWTAAQDWENYE